MLIADHIGSKLKILVRYDGTRIVASVYILHTINLNTPEHVRDLQKFLGVYIQFAVKSPLTIRLLEKVPLEMSKTSGLNISTKR